MPAEGDEPTTTSSSVRMNNDPSAQSPAVVHDLSGRDEVRAKAHSPLVATRTADASSNAPQRSPVDLPVLFIRAELRDRRLRISSPDTRVVVDVPQSVDDHTHVPIPYEQAFRFNGLAFHWLPGECKQNQPIFFLSDGIHVAHVSGKLVVQNATERHELAFDPSYQSYLVCIWSYDDHYHVSALGKHRTHGWDASWYGITVRRQPQWQSPAPATLHVHRSLQRLVWYQSNANEASIPDEHYLQSIAHKRFQ